MTQNNPMQDVYEMRTSYIQSTTDQGHIDTWCTRKAIHHKSEDEIIHSMQAQRGHTP